MKNKLIIFYFILIMLVNLSCYSNDIFEVKDKIETKRAIVIVDNLRLRENADLNSNILGNLNTGDIVEVLSTSNKKDKIDSMLDYWYKVKFGNKIGFVYGFFINEFNNKKIIKNDKNGFILFFDDSYKIISKITYDSYYIISKKIEKNKSYDKQASLVEIIDDSFALLKRIKFYYTGSEYLVSNYTIYNRKGDIILSDNGLPVIFFSNKLNYLIVNKAMNNESYKIKYKNELEILSDKGKKVKKLKLDMESNYKDEFENNEMFINKSEDKFIWVNNTKVLILDLKKFKVKYIDFKKIEKFNPEEVFINLSKVSVNDNSLNVELSPFNFVEGIDYEKIIINIKGIN